MTGGRGWDKNDVNQMQGGRPNFRFIFTVSVLVAGGLLAIAVVLVGYAIATQHAIGRYAPIGSPTNVKQK